MPPPKHSARPLGPARTILSAASAILVMLIVWIAVRAVGPAEAAREPTLVMPSTSVEPSTPVPPSASPSRSRSKAATRTAKSTTATRHTPVPEKTTTKPSAPKPTATKTTSKRFFVTVSVGASWEQGYVAMVRVKNEGGFAAGWKVTVTHRGVENMRLLGVWNARGTQSGTSVIFTGDHLAAGATASFGYQVSMTGKGNARPSGCSVVGGKCSVG